MNAILHFREIATASGNVYRTHFTDSTGKDFTIELALDRAWAHVIDEEGRCEIWTRQDPKDTVLTFTSGEHVTGSWTDAEIDMVDAAIAFEIPGNN